MRTIALVALLAFGLVSSADAGRRGGGGGGSHSSGSHSGSHSGMTGTGSSSSSHAVRGYTTRRGTYVAPHHQTNPDRTQRNNDSTRGNVNPWTGKAGTRLVAAAAVANGSPAVLLTSDPDDLERLLPGEPQVHVRKV